MLRILLLLAALSNTATTTVGSAEELTTDKLLEALQLTRHDLLPEVIKIGHDEPPLPGFFLREIEDNSTDNATLAEARRLYTQALQTLQQEKVTGVKKTTEVMDYLNQASKLGHKTSSKLLAYFHLFEGNFHEIDKIKRTFESLSLAGSADAQFGLGFLHATGLGGVKQSQAKALTYYNFAALAGCPMAMMAMAYRYQNGLGVRKQCFQGIQFYYDVAFQDFATPRFFVPSTDPKLHLTDAFDPDATRRQQLPSSSEEEIDYVKFRIAQGDSSQLAVQIGQLYLTGKQGLPQNYELAKKYLKEAAQAGEASAMTYLGIMYLDGTPVTPASNLTAYKYFYDAAMKGDANAVCGLGYMYQYGYGVNVDYNVAKTLLVHAVNKGSTLANVYLGIFLERQGAYGKAAKLYEAAAGRGDTSGVYNLARLKALGVGVPQSCIIATQLFRIAAERGELSKKLMEAFLAYKRGNYKKAAGIYLLLAEMGFESAQLNFAHLVDQDLVPIEKPEALIYWKRASGQGSSYATVKLGDLYYYGRGVDKNSTEAFEHYKLAAQNYKSAHATFNLGVMHERGEGAAKDVHLARRYYQLASELSSNAYYPTYLAELRLDLLEWFEQNTVFQRLDSYFKYWDVVCCGLIAFIVSYLVFSFRHG